MRRYFFTLALLVLITSPLAAQPMLVSTDWLQANLHRVKVIDVGDQTSYDAGHAPGAVFVDFTSIVTDIDGVPNELPPIDKLETVFRNAGAGDSGRIVLYSRDPLHAFRAWFTLDYLGHGYRTSVLDGGYAKWSAEGRTTSTVRVVPSPALFQASVRSDAITRLRPMIQLVRNFDALGPSLVLIDVRPAPQFSGEEPGPDIKHGGHIPGAINIPWQENFTTETAPVLRSVGDLRALYEGAGVTKASSNVVYCRTGMQATVPYFVLKYIGYQATLYDGSFSEWSNSGQIVQ